MPGRSVVVRLSAEVSGYVAGMTRAGAATSRAMGVSEAAVAKANRENARHQKLLAGVGTAAKYSGIAVAGGLALAVKEAADFNEKMALVQSLSHANGREMRQLSASAMHTGTSFGYTATSVADGEAEMIKAGVSLRNIMGGGLRGTLSLAAAGQTDVATASSIAASALTQFKLRGADIPHVADLLAAGADKALGSVEDLGYGMSQVGTTAHQMGLSVEDTVGTLAEFAQAGQTGEKGGTLLNQMLLQLASPSKQAKKLMDQYGLSLYNAAGQMKTMPEIAGNLRRSFADLTPAERNAALGVIFGSRAIRGANILIADGEKGNRKWIRSVNDQGFAAQQARGKLNSLKGDMQKLKAEGVNALIDLGSGSQSPLRRLVQGITGDIHHLVEDGSLRRWGNETAQALEAVVNGAKPVVEIGGKILSTFNALPGPVKTGLVTAGLTTLALRKLPGVSPGRGVVSGALGGTRGGVVPVFVTNAGFGPGTGKGVPGTVVAGEKAATGRFGRVGALASRASGLFSVPSLVVGTLTLSGIKNAKSGNAAIGSGAAGGAYFGAELGGPIGALAGAGIGAVVGAESYKAPEQKAYLDSMSKHGKNVKELVAAYKLLETEQKRLGGKVGDTFPPAVQINARKMRDVLHQIGKETGLTGKTLRAFARGDQLPTSWTAKDELNQVAFGAQKAGVSTQQLGRMFGTLPDQVVTKFLTPGAVKSKADARSLGRQYGLTPRQIRTLIQLLGFRDAEDKVKHHKRSIKDLNGQTAKPRVTPNDADVEPKLNKHKKSLHVLDGTTAKPRVTVNDDATPTINRIGGAVAGLNGKHATITITTQRVTHYSTTGSTKGKPLPDPNSAAGNIFRAFAAGDVANGHQALIERMPKYRMWAEPETKGESYIPLADDWRRPRAIAIWEETGRLLGQYGAGGLSRMAGGGVLDDLHYKHSIRGVTRELNKLTEALKNTRQNRHQYNADVRQAYMTDPFGGTLGGFDSQVAYETRRITGASADLTTLRKHGLSGALYKNLAVSGNATLIDQFSHLSRAQIAARERAYNTELRQDRALGNQVAGAVYAKEMRTNTQEIRELRRELHRLRTGHHIGNTNIKRQVNNHGGGKSKSGNRRLKRS